MAEIISQDATERNRKWPLHELSQSNLQKLAQDRPVRLEDNHPSKTQHVSGMARLPNVIDVERFVDVCLLHFPGPVFSLGGSHDDSRLAPCKTRCRPLGSVHISCRLQQLIVYSASSTHRAWQTLPRHLRRRAASHDVRRVPVRLRQKAAAEVPPHLLSGHLH